jgi:PAS domain S-box-containing protein
MKKVSVLLIDDDEDDYILAKDVFGEISRPERYELSWVDTFDKGINAALKQQYDIYLVDYRLGKHTGVDLITEAILSGVKEPLIILTGKGDEKIDQEALNIGAADYLIKENLNPSTLDRSLRYALKQAKTIKALKESEHKFRAIFDKSKDPILISDYSGKIYDINTAGLNFFGYNSLDINDVNDRQLFRTPEDRESFVQQLETKGAVNNFECEMLASSGQAYFCSLSSFLEIDTQNMTEVYHTIIHDLTNRKNKEVKSIYESKFSVSEHIAKGFAEEIRNPLSTINLVLHELLTDENLAYNETVQTNLEEIRTSLDSIDQLTKNFITSTEAKPLDRQKVNINNLIEEVLLSLSDKMAGQRVVLEKDLLPTPTTLFIDVKQIKEVLTNIIDNAIEAMETFPKTLNISSIKDSGYYSIMIEDNGKSVPMGDDSKIFEPFFTTKKDKEGLGLTIAERLILAHNGNIFFRRQEVGSLFVIQIPLN